LIQGDVYVLDKGSKVSQLNTKTSAGQERFKAAEFVRNLADNRMHKCEVVVYGKTDDRLACID
jgi:gelsolin